MTRACAPASLFGGWKGKVMETIGDLDARKEALLARVRSGDLGAAEEVARIEAQKRERDVDCARPFDPNR